MAANPPEHAPTEASIVERLTIVAESIAPAYAALVSAQEALQQLLAELTTEAKESAYPQDGPEER